VNEALRYASHTLQWLTFRNSSFTLPKRSIKCERKTPIRFLYTSMIDWLRNSSSTFLQRSQFAANLPLDYTCSFCSIFTDNLMSSLLVSFARFCCQFAVRFCQQILLDFCRQSAIKICSSNSCPQIVAFLLTRICSKRWQNLFEQTLLTGYISDRNSIAKKYIIHSDKRKNYRIMQTLCWNSEY